MTSAAERDGHQNIPVLAQMYPDDFEQLTRTVLRRARQWHAPILSAQDGGYNRHTAVASALWHVRTLASG